MKDETMSKIQTIKQCSELKVVREDHDIRILYQKDRAKAFDRLVTKYMKLLFYHAYHMVKDYEEAKDMSQEVLLKAFEQPHFFTESESIKGWLIRVLSNQCIDHLRSQTVKGKYQNQSEMKEHLLSPQDHFMNDENKEILNIGIDKLPPIYKNVIILKYYHDLSYSEIAEILQCEMGTVMSRLSRAKKILEGEFQNV